MVISCVIAHASDSSLQKAKASWVVARAFNPRALGTETGGDPEFKDSLSKTLGLHRETLSGGRGGGETRWAEDHHELQKPNKKGEDREIEEIET